ncbi:TPA: hypothetical protein L8N48_003703 [Klebsiella pneumoniae]|uniref:hypothetical protein n=1 Tax=Klebsiella TaxID=570 RepID=UPI00103514E9|nr:hypothetical protein [Klebsiella pneumoniae]ELW9389093.1 hypothetical protein [Klebsiella pneumoniae]MBC4184349.1 hypothetical protein [Klebsiella pneumoniae]MCU8678097.1 hypothetical protein [Klebsiella pneumoniae]MCU8686900.1 hypothetical protein [Klebsiella pneumoniae]MEA4683251.1 hypothetical protein [Klebsiella pneumoniae]
MKLKSFIAKAAVVAILSGVVYAPAHFLYQDNEQAQWNVVKAHSHDPITKPYSEDAVATGYRISGGVCFKNTLEFIYPDYDTKAECEQAAQEFKNEFDPLFNQGLIYGRTMLASLAVLILSLGSIVVSLSFVGLRKLWNVGK